MTTAGEVKLFPVETCPADMAPGPDGNVWYVASYKPGEMAARIGRITPSGEVTEFTIDRTRILSDGTRMTNMPTAIVPGPDGAMWFNFPETSQLARIATGVESSSADQVVVVPARASRAQVARGLQLPARCVESCVVNASMVAGGKVVARKRVALRKPGTRRISLKARLRASTKSVSVRFKSDTWSKVGAVPVRR